MMSKLPVTPTGYRLLVRQKAVMDKNEAGEHVSDGGIVLLDDTVSREEVGQDQGEVMAIGESCFTSYNQRDEHENIVRHFKVGDTVLFAKYAGMGFREKANPDFIWRVINDEDVAGIVHTELTNP